MHVHGALARYWLVAAIALMTAASGVFGEEATDPPPKVDFSYAFATPHRMTVGRPDASDRTLLDLQPLSLRMAWSYDNLAMPHFAPLSFRTPPTLWNIQITPQIDGKPPAKSRWTRLDGVLPGLENVYEDPACTVRLEAIGGATAALIRIEIANPDAAAHQVVLRCDSGAWGENPAWLDPARNVGDHLLAGWNDRADRVLVLGIGADAYSLQGDGLAPGPRNMVLVWNLKPGEKRTGWLVRPYHGYAADLPALREADWAREMEQGKKEWRDLLARAVKVTVPDADVARAYLACFGDLFIMREPVSNGRIASVPGTEGYRAGGSGEPAIVAVALDQNGFHKEAAEGYRVSIEAQGDDGNWADPAGWMHRMWCASGFKCWTIMEHYRLTRDKELPRRSLPADARQLAVAGDPASHDAARRRRAAVDLRLDAARLRRLRPDERQRSVRRVPTAQHLGGLRRPVLARSGGNPRQDRRRRGARRRSTKRLATICSRPSTAGRSRRRIIAGFRACRARRAGALGGR